MSGEMIVLAAGGTGGHLYPAAALSEALATRGYRLALFCDRRARIAEGAFGGAGVVRIAAGSPGGQKVKAALGMVRLGLGVLQASRHLRRMAPSLVIGFGGYPSVPPLVAASRAGVPILLHEQNAVLGRANRWLLPRARAVATSFAEVAGLEGHADIAVRMTGNPVREAVSRIAEAPYALGDTGGPFRILVLGGSQGATRLSEVVPAAIARLSPAGKRRLVIAQQCRPADLQTVERAYREIGVDFELAAFFDDVPRRLSDCHLVICRAGASTIAELTAAGRPAILVPYPHATDDHQRANARAIAGAGAGWLMGEDVFSPPALAARLEAIMHRPRPLIETAAASRALGVRDAALRLADFAEALIAHRNGGDAPAPFHDPRKDKAA